MYRTKDFERMIPFYSIKNDRKIKSICQPLVDFLGIPFFTYFRIDENGNMVNFANHIEQCEYYYSEKHYQANPYNVHPNLIRSGCVWLKSTQKKDYLELMREYERKFQLYNPFMIIEKSEKAFEGFFFATSTSTDTCHQYMNNLEALKKFGRYFTREAASLIKKMDLEGLNIKDAKGALFLERDKKLPLANDDLHLDKFLDEISLLSPQENKCLEFFRKGNSAQATAAKMGISNRTVEHYFESIKSKFNCSSKWDLLNI